MGAGIVGKCVGRPSVGIVVGTDIWSTGPVVGSVVTYSSFGAPVATVSVEGV